MKKSIEKKFFLSVVMIAATTVFSACRSIPKEAKAVENFNAASYMGKWYEIARLDFIHEQNMNNVTATYYMNHDGSIRIVNTGYNYVKLKWKTSEGRGVFTGKKNIGMLKVSFFRPFYSGYNVIAIDENYNYSLVAGANHKYLWILSRTPQIPEDVKNNYLKIAGQAGYDTRKLIWTKHNK